jgi:SulP family sulfate permease
MIHRNPLLRRVSWTRLQERFWTSVRALDLSRVSAMDATGLSMVAEVLDRHPHLDVWVTSAKKSPALQHAGVAEDRIHILGNGLVRPRDVLAAIQSNVPMELAPASAKTQ